MPAANKVYISGGCIFKKTNMTFEKTYEVQKDNRIIIKLPERFKSKKRVKVIIEDVDDSRQEKIKLLRKATKDPLFLSDIYEVNSDFADSDFYDLSLVRGTPPKIIWLRAGNTSTKSLAKLIRENEIIIKEFLEHSDYKEISCLEID